MKVTKYEIELEEIENYTKQGTILRSKEKRLLNKEKPTKCFLLLGKTKTKEKKKNNSRK